MKRRGHNHIRLGIGLVGLMLMGSGCIGPEAMTLYYEGDYDSVIQTAEPQAKCKGPGQALHALRCASACLTSGRYEDAREYLGLAGGIMEDFWPDGEFAARVGAESAKDYRGDPYEKMLAFFYLGLIDYAVGEYDKALASFKTAALADGGTRDDRYRSDSLLVFLMEAMAARKCNETEQVSSAISLATKVERFKYTVDCAESAIALARDELVAEEGTGWFKGSTAAAIRAAAGLLHARLSAAAMDTHKPAEALSMAMSATRAFMASPKASKDGNIRQAKRYLQKIFQRASKKLPVVCAQRVPQRDAAVRVAKSAEWFREHRPNLLIVVQTGKGPYKSCGGSYGEQSGFGRQIGVVRDCAVRLSGKPLTVQFTEDVYFQASTRGARKMDEINAAKAAFKHLFGALAVADPTGGAFLVFLMITPQADARYWDTLPDRLHLVAAEVPPGTYSLEVQYFSEGRRPLPHRTRTLPSLTIEPGRDYVLLVRETPRKSPDTWLVRKRPVEPSAYVKADAPAGKE